MPFIFNTRSYSNVSREFNNFLNWLKENEINFNSSRSGKYKEVLDLAKTRIESNAGFADLLQKGYFVDFVNSFYEADELLSIYEGLKDHQIDDELRRRFKIILSGPTYIFNELGDGASGAPRNISLELFIGAKLEKVGVTVEFTHDWDIKCLDAAANIYIECKRPSSIKNFKKNIKKSFEQLAKHYSRDSGGRGFICISINKLINPGQKILQCKNRNEVEVSLKSIVGKFIEKHGSLWHTRRDGKTLGVLVLLQTPVIVESENYMLAVGAYVGINNLIMPENHEFNTFSLFTDKIARAILS